MGKPLEGLWWLLLSVPIGVFATGGLLGCWVAGLLDGDISTMKIGLVPGNSVPMVSRKQSTPPFPSNLLAFLPNVRWLEGIRVESKGWWI